MGNLVCCSALFECLLQLSAVVTDDNVSLGNRAPWRNHSNNSMMRRALIIETVDPQYTGSRFEIYDLVVEIYSVIEHAAKGLILVPEKENVILT